MRRSAGVYSYSSHRYTLAAQTQAESIASMTRLLPLLFIVLVSLSGCAALTEEHDPYKGWTAEEFYRNAHDALESGNYLSAIEIFTALEARFPYGQYAQQAQLETAYAHYKAGEPAAAVAAAERFIKLHPRHENVDYAYYIRGLASFDQGEGLFDRFVPDAKSRRDPQELRTAFGYFKELVTRFPESEYRKDASQRMLQLRNLLAEYELKVAEHYLKRAAYLAAANRAKYVVENYPQTPAVPAALKVMVEAYRNMGMEELARDALRVLRKSYPEQSTAVDAMGLAEQAAE